MRIMLSRTPFNPVTIGKRVQRILPPRLGHAVIQSPTQLIQNLRTEGVVCGRAVQLQQCECARSFQLHQLAIFKMMPRDLSAFAWIGRTKNSFCEGRIFSICNVNHRNNGAHI